MGHQHLGTLPRSQPWQRVVALISAGAPVSAIAAETSKAAELQMVDASDDPGVSRSFWLLTQIPKAACETDFGTSLRGIGLQVGDSPTLFEIAGAMCDALDRFVDKMGRSDLGEMAELSALESFCAVAGRALNDLFEVTPEATRRSVAELAGVNQFAVLSRDFFSRLLRRLISYFLSRELSQHVGSNSRFTTVWQHRDFEIALDQHCRETSRIIKEFSGQWYSKQMYLGGIDQNTASRFAHVAFEKLRSELRHRRGTDG